MLEQLTGPCIITKYLGPTDYKGTRVKATHVRDSKTKWSKTISWNHCKGAEENHQQAAQELINSWPLNEYFNFKLKGRGHDHNHYYFIADSINE